MVKKIFIQLGLFFMILIFIGAWSGLESGYRTFYGQETFNTVDEAMIYQEKVIKTAMEYGAKVIESDITVTSPPKYSFNIRLPISENTRGLFSGEWKLVVPKHYHFEYGTNTSSSEWAFYSWMTLFFIMTFGSFGFFTWAIWFTKESEDTK